MPTIAWERNNNDCLAEEASLDGGMAGDNDGKRVALKRTSFVGSLEELRMFPRAVGS